MEVPSQLLLCETTAKHLVEGPGHCEPTGPAVLKRRTEERARTNQKLLASLCLSLPPLDLTASEHKFLFGPTRGERILGNKVPANLIGMSHHRGMTEPFAETRHPGGGRCRATWYSCACRSLLKGTWLRDPQRLNP